MRSNTNLENFQADLRQSDGSTDVRNNIYNEINKDFHAHKTTNLKETLHRADLMLRDKGILPNVSLEALDTRTDKALVKVNGAAFQLDKGTVEKLGINTGEKAATSRQEKGEFHSSLQETKNADGSIVHADKNGRILDITRTNGTTRHFKYDNDGKVSKIEYGDSKGGAAEVWQKVGEHQWVAHQDGKPARNWSGDVELIKDGTIISKSATGKLLIENPDGSDVWKNEKGQITGMRDATGKCRWFEYDKDGHLSGIKYAEKGGFKDSWKKEGDAWVNYDQHGSKTGRTLGAITLKQDGTLIEQNRKGDENLILKRDGSSERQKTQQAKPESSDPKPGSKNDRSESKQKDQPEPKQNDRPDSRQNEKTTERKSWHELRKEAMQSQKDEIDCTGERKVRAGDTLWDIARASKELNSKDGHKPSNQEIMEEAKRIAKLNNIKDMNIIAIGTTLKVSG